MQQVQKQNNTMKQKWKKKKVQTMTIPETCNIQQLATYAYTEYMEIMRQSGSEQVINVSTKIKLKIEKQ